MLSHTNQISAVILFPTSLHRTHPPTQINPRQICWTGSVISGAHNYIRAEGKGRSMQRPHKRLKFENVLTVVLLLFLACMRMCANMCTETSQRTRKSTRTLFAVKQRKETVTDLEKCCTTR